MSTLTLKTNNTFTTDVMVCKSDPYSGAVFVTFNQVYGPDKIRGCSEMFMTPDELNELGSFLIQQAAKIKSSQLE